MSRLPLPKSAFVRRYLVVMTVLTIAAILASLALRSGVRARSGEAVRGDFVTPSSLGRIAGFSLTNQNGVEFGSSDLAGRFYLADFIFTSCAGVCPAMTSEMASIYREFEGEGRLQFVSISVDPETDTPERLAEFASRYGATAERWNFLTGPIGEIQSLARDQFLLGYGDEPVNHSSRFVLVDGEGAIRGFYDGTDPASTAQLRADLRALLDRSPAQD